MPSTENEKRWRPMTLDVTGFEMLSVCGQRIYDSLLSEWFGEKVKPDRFHVNKSLGCAVTLDHLSRVQTVFLFASRVEGANKPYTGVLPGGLTWDSSRARAKEALGTVESSGEPADQPVTSIFHSPYPWDRWSVDAGVAASGGFLRIEYTETGDRIRSVAFQGLPLRDPWSVTLEIFASYYQFVVGDQAQVDDLDKMWDENATNRQFAPGPSGQLVGIGTRRYGNVPVTVSWYPEEPKLDPKGIDRINECGLTIVTSLGVGNYVSDVELQPVDLGPGTYGLRVLYQFQDQVTNDQEGNDQYVMQLWPVSEPPPLRYIKPKPPKVAKPK